MNKHFDHLQKLHRSAWLVLEGLWLDLFAQNCFETTNSSDELRSQPSFGDIVECLQIFFISSWPDKCIAVPLSE